MSAQTLELTLARLYTDPIFRERFLSDAVVALEHCELSEHERESVLQIDRAGLVMASKSFLSKRKKKMHHRSTLKIWMTRLKDIFL